MTNEVINEVTAASAAPCAPESGTRSRGVSAEEGQDSFPWPTTRDAASLPLNSLTAGQPRRLMDKNFAVADRERPWY